MACPQCEDGYTRIAHELLEAICRADFSKRQLKVLLAVIRQTYGFGRKADVISAGRLAALTGLDERHCRRTVAELVDIGVLHSAATGKGKRIGIVKDYERWGAKPAQAEKAKGGPKQPGPKQPGPKQPGEGQNGPGQNGPGGEGQNGPQGGAKTAHHNIKKESGNTPPPHTEPKSAHAPEPVPGGGGCSSDLIFPRGLSPQQRTHAARLVSGCNDGQDVLDELAGLMAAGAIRVSPLACLRGLVRAEQAGAFTLEAGATVRRAREQEKRSASRPEAAHQEDTDEVLRQHAALLGVSAEEYLRKMGRA